jgi:hypothetical protein
MLRYCRRRCGQVRLGALRRIRSMRPERLKRSHGALRVCRFRYPPTPHAACPSTLLLKGGGHGTCICVAGARWRDVAVLRRWAAVVAASTACDAELGLFPAGSAQPPLAPHRRALRTPRSWQGKYMIPETPSWQGSQRAPRRTPSRGCGLEQLEGEFKLQEPRGPGGVRLNADGLGAYVSLARILMSTSSRLTVRHDRPAGRVRRVRQVPRAATLKPGPEAKSHHKESLHAGKLVHPPCPLPNRYMRLHGRTGGRSLVADVADARW